MARAAADEAPTAAPRARLLGLAVECSADADPGLRLDAAEALGRHQGRYRDAIALLESFEFAEPDESLDATSCSQRPIGSRR